MVIPGFLKFSHGIKPTQIIQPVVNKGPGTVLVMVYFTFALIRTAAGTIHQALVTGGNRAYSACFTQE